MHESNTRGVLCLLAGTSPDPSPLTGATVPGNSPVTLWVVNPKVKRPLAGNSVAGIPGLRGNQAPTTATDKGHSGDKVGSADTTLTRLGMFLAASPGFTALRKGKPQRRPPVLRPG